MSTETETASVVSVQKASGMVKTLTVESNEKPSTASSSSSASSFKQIDQPRFRSRRYKKEDIQQPWLGQKHPREKFAWILPLCGLIFGIIMTALMCYIGLSKVPKHSYCSVLDESFSSGAIDSNIWTQELSVLGGGNGEFQQTTNTAENSFIDSLGLHIKPTLQDASLIENDNTLSLYSSGCTGTWANCVAVTNTTNGTIINPVKSARLTTKTSIKFGRVEVVAKMPKGDWLWPAIWMLPVNNTYGVWPASGEIDIAESRGNNYTYSTGGYNVMRSTLHWGPNQDEDRYLLSTGTATVEHSTWADGFHTYGLEFSEKYLFTWVDSRLNQVYYLKYPKGGMWAKGSPFIQQDPWTQGTRAAPFDQSFYLILNVAVGGTNGYFPDGIGGKPWSDKDADAPLEFWNARNQWYPTWEKSGEMVVKSVRMWQEAGFEGCKA